MEIRRWHIIINCVVIIPYLAAKPFSLNEAIAAEKQQKNNLDTTSQPTGTAAERFSLKALRTSPLKAKKLKLTGLIPLNKKISSLKYKKSFQIKSPLKPKKLKYAKRHRLKRKNQFLRHENNDNERFNQKYIPLLRNIGMLFDNLLTSDVSESREIRENKFKRTRHNTRRIYEKNGVVCTCSRKSDIEASESKAAEKTIAPTTVVPTEISIDNETVGTEAPTTTTNNPSTGNINPLGQHKDIPLLPARDTHSSRRNNFGFSEGGRPTFHRSIEGDITRDHRDSEHDTRCGEIRSSSTYDEEDSDGDTRDGASCDRTGGGIRGNGNDTRSTIVGRPIEGEESGREQTDETKKLSIHENTIGHFRGKFDELEGINQLEVERDETKSTTSVPQFIRGDRRFIYEEETFNNMAERDEIQSKEMGHESLFNVPHNIPRDQRISDRDGAHTEEDQKIGRTNETMKSNKDLLITGLIPNFSKNKAQYVTIIDGYSVARDKNGQNKLSEKSIHYHS